MVSHSNKTQKLSMLGLEQFEDDCIVESHHSDII
jgi:hypothetical protein